MTEKELKKVCAYARVSTDSKMQLNSLKNQVNFFVDYIKNNNNCINKTKGIVDLLIR